MSERERPQPSPRRAAVPWNISAAAEILHAKVSIFKDAQFGPGSRLDLSEGDGQLWLHPERLLARYRGSSVHLELANVHELNPAPDALRIASTAQRFLTVALLSANGGLSLSSRFDSEPIDAAVAAATEAPPAAEAKASIPASETEKAARVIFTGRLGRDPSMRSTTGGRLIAKIPLAVHQGERTEWHSIFFFDKLATKAVETLHKGDMTTVVGYRHRREAPNRSGGTRSIEEIYAVAIRTPNVRPG